MEKMFKYDVVHFTMGLPASGKTTFAKKYKEDQSSFVVLVELDDFLKKKYTFSNNAKEQIEAYNLSKSGIGHKELFIDGLFTNTNMIMDFIKMYLKNISTDKIIIHYWDADKEQCLKNDEMRNKVQNEKSATLTIKLSSYKEPTNEDMTEIIRKIKNHMFYKTKILPSVTFVKHKVYKGN